MGALVGGIGIGGGGGGDLWGGSSMELWVSVWSD